MNLFKKAFSSQNQPKEARAEFGTDFKKKQKQYFEIDKVLAKLIVDIRRFNQLWNDLIAVKSQIFGYLLYFYTLQNKKRDAVDNIFKYHQSPLEDAIRNLCENYQYNVIQEIQKIRQIFPLTKNEIDSLLLKKNQWQHRKASYVALKKMKRVNYAYLTQLDEEVRNAKHDFLFHKRKILREFDSKLEARESMMDPVVEKVALSYIYIFLVCFLSFSMFILLCSFYF